MYYIYIKQIALQYLLMEKVIIAVDVMALIDIHGNDHYYFYCNSH